MLVCENCGCQNPLGALSCHTCHMKGSLVLPSPIETTEDTEEEVVFINCFNCGKETAKAIDKCEHCFFPLPNNTLGNSSKQLLPLVKSIRKTG